MKLIIVTFLLTIFAVFAVPTGDRIKRCIEPSKEMENAYLNCFRNVSQDTFDSLMTYNKTAATREAKCLAKCIYTGTGEFKDGKFDGEKLEKYWRNYVGPNYADAELLEKVIQVHRNGAAAGNAEPGDDCEKAYAYHAAVGDVESQRILNDFFCA